MTNDASGQKEIPFQDVIKGLLDDDRPLNPLFLYRLSDLEGEELTELQKSWPDISDPRKLGLLEDLEELFEIDYLLSFESIFRLGVNDADRLNRFVAIRSLQEYEVVDLIPVYIDILENDKDDELRALAATSLGKYVYLGEIEEQQHVNLSKIENCLLKVALGQEKSLVQRRAVESLGYSSHKEVPKLIEKAFSSSDINWLTTAICAMGRSYSKRWHSKVLKILDHSALDVRFEAVKAAGELELSKAKPKLLELLDDSDPDIRMAAVWSLSQIGGEGLQKYLEMLLEKTESEKEAELIEEALDNLIFNESIGIYDSLDYEFTNSINDEDPKA